MTGVLETPTLVLDRQWRPVRMTTVRDALRLAYLDAARPIDPDTYQALCFDEWVAVPVDAGERSVQAVRGPIKAPHVVQLTRHRPLSLAAPVFSRQNVFRRDRFRCQYCGTKLPPEKLTLDYVVPPSRGGSVDWVNCVACCLSCRQRKGDRLPDEAGMTLRRKPFQPSRMW